MSLQIGLLFLCLARLSFGEPPVAPYPAAGRPSGPQFSPGTGNQFQDLPEVIDGRSLNNEEANHRIHFNLFKDHETRKSKDNIAFKLGQRDAFGRGDQNFGQNFQGGLDNKYGAPGRNDLSQKYGAPQTNSLSKNYGAPNFNQQSFSARQGHDISSNYGPPSQNSGPSTQYGAPQGYEQGKQQSNGYQNDYQSSPNFGRQQNSQGFQPQPQYGPPQSSLPSSFSNRPSELYGTPHSSIPSGKSLAQQPSSSYGTPRNFQQPSQAYGVPGQGQNQLSRRLDQNQHKNGQYNSANGYNLQKQGYAMQYNGQEQLSDDMTVTEKANYEFEYEVRGDKSHGHEESREGDEAWGSYRVQLPDGRTMLVEYTADDRGYRPKISYTEDQDEQQPY